MIKNIENQVEDDPSLLELMLKDYSKAPDYYKASNFWMHYEKKFLPELRSMGLHNFRRRKNSVLTEFGATDLLPLTEFLRKPNHDTIKLRFLRSFVNLASLTNSGKKFLDIILKVNYGIKSDDVNLLCYEFAKNFGKINNAKSIEEIEDSLVGNPENFFYVNKKKYTISFLDYYIR